MNSHLPYSQACENNKAPILEKLRDVFTAPDTVLEIGTGTGQHAEHFAAALPHLQWQPTDHPRAAHLAVARLEQAALPNVLPMLELDVNQMPWPVPACRWAFSANTAHIMAWEEVEKMFQGVGACLQKGGAFCLYGPFKHEGEFTSESNKTFDQSLKAKASHMGIRDIEDLSVLAETTGLALKDDYAMPANNEMLIFRR
ncbi:DUF938 domain-containing protein [Marinobacter hydrocarbonoclasticus]|uniref:DUF938 domain-containing protein n=1 Tax=Marinobacter nauticus TaxID=2743 RepID=UPI001C947229|nr:DUF938 domain-containing protein [Marinobacter nauticus]MBY6192553.1 DUF938 domain-containing protein [Marinobacter nauticus]MBY6213701.1 DUF938 domain-containing protein [Marinobacter nauticus]